MREKKRDRYRRQYSHWIIMGSCISATFKPPLPEITQKLRRRDALRGTSLQCSLTKLSAASLRLVYLRGKANELSQIHDGEPPRNYTSQSAVRVTSATRAPQTAPQRDTRRKEERHSKHTDTKPQSTRVEKIWTHFSDSEKEEKKH
ncbi:hypothetical protein MHYP_G00092580 [Metynnis hypsauchen]